MMDAKLIKMRRDRAFKRRNVWLDTWDDMVRLTMPGRESFFEEEPGAERMDDIYDETGIVALDDFVSNLEALLTPQGLDLVRFKPGTDVPRSEHQQMQADLDEVSRIVNEELQNTNYFSAKQETYLDLAIGTVGTMIEDHGAGRGIVNTPVPMKHFAIDIGPDGEPDGKFRDRTVCVGHIENIWRGATLPDSLRTLLNNGDMYKEIVLHEATWRDWSNHNEEVYEYGVLDPGSEEIIFKQTYKGEGSNPWICGRWSRASKEWWGRGPLFRALPAIRVANLMEEYSLENAELAISGLFQADDDGSVNLGGIDVEPGTVIPVRPNSNGIRPIEMPRTFDLSSMKIGDIQSNIRKALFAEDLGAPEGTPASATEIVARRNRVARSMSSFYPRLKREIIDPEIRRYVYLLKQQGKIELPRINGREVTLSLTSPIARAQSQQEIESIVTYIGTSRQLLGERETMMRLNPDRIESRLSGLFGIPTEILSTEAERTETKEQMAQAAQMAERQQPGGAQRLLQEVGQDATPIQ